MGPFQTLDQIPHDPQVEANDYLIEVDAGDGRTFTLVASPVQFDEMSLQSCARDPSRANTPKRSCSSWVLTGSKSRSSRRSASSTS